MLVLDRTPKRTLLNRDERCRSRIALPAGCLHSKLTNALADPSKTGRLYPVGTMSTIPNPRRLHMQQHLAELRRRRADGDHGFTLIELLVVVVIIGILIAIAIPVYLNYQKGAKDKSAASDVRNAIGVLEQCNSDNNTYPATIGTDGTIGGTPPACSQKINLTAGTTLTYVFGGTAAVPAYIMSTTNSGGSGNKNFCYDSAVGGSVKTIATAATAAMLSGNGCA